MTMRDEPIRVAQIVGKLASAGVEAVVNNYWRCMDHEAFRFDYYIDEDSVCEPSREMLDSGANQQPEQPAPLISLYCSLV